MTDTKALKVLVYSDDVHTREQVILALGRRPHPDLPEVEYVEVATEPVVIQNMDAGTVDLAILDGEAGDLGRGGLAGEQLAHRPRGLGRVEVRAGDQGPEDLGPAGGVLAHVLAGTRARSSETTVSASWIGSSGCGTAASARDQVASQASCGRPVSTTTGGHW